MDLNLVLATGLAYTFLGALILIASHRALYHKATRVVASYPKVLTGLQAQRYDNQMGLILIVCGSVLQVLAAYGYSISPDYWLYPGFAAAAVFCAYAASRLFAAWRTAGTQSEAARARAPVHQFHETRRSMVLLEAARREAASHQARELAREPRDRGVVYLTQDWECRWWCDRLDVSPEVLKAAVRQVGPMLQDIERHLRVTSRTPTTLAA